MAFPSKKPAAAVDPELDAVSALMSEDPAAAPAAEGSELPPEKPAVGNPEELLAEIEGALAELRQLVAR